MPSIRSDSIRFIDFKLVKHRLKLENAIDSGPRSHDQALLFNTLFTKRCRQSNIICYDFSQFFYSHIFFFFGFVLIKFVVIIIYNAIIFVKAFHLLSLPYFYVIFFLNFSFLKITFYLPF